MSDKLSQEEIDVLTGNGDLSELEPLKNAFNVCLESATETLSSIINTPNIKYNEAQVEMLSASDLKFDSGDISIRIGLKSGLSGYSFLNLSTETCENIAASMIGTDDISSLSEDIIHSALCEAMNQTMGGICTTLSRSLNDTIDISTPDVILTEGVATENLFNGAFKKDTTICKISYTLNISENTAKMFFVFILNTAKSASFKIKTTESKNLLRLNPELSKTIAEYFTLLGVKYKAIYSMIGVMDNVSVLELNSIHSLQCLDVDIINNYNIVNKNQQKDLYNIYIFEKDFVSDVKKTTGLLDDEDTTWDILKELNNQFSYIFLEYCSDNNLVFDNVECNNFLELPDNQYLLVSFCVGDYKFYQLLSFALVDKIKTNISNADRAKIDAKTIENLTEDRYNVKNSQKAELTNPDLKDIPEVFRQMPFVVSAELGEKIYTIKDLLHFNTGYIIHFDKKVAEDIDICVNNVKKAEGEVGQLTYNKSNNYAVKIKKIIKE